MRITVVAIGSTGDVAPYLGVGAHLVDAGHEVRFATHEPFRDWVRDSGLEFALLPMDPRVHMTAELAAEIRRGGARGARAVADASGPGFARSPWRSTRSSTTATCYSGQPSAGPGCTAQVRGVPAARLHLQPLVPTGEFAPPALGARSFGPLANRALGRMTQRAMVEPYLDVVDELRAGHGAGHWSVREHLRFLSAAAPTLHGFSRHLVPKPRDWRHGIEVVGYWTPPSIPNWAPDSGLVDFLASGPRPVYVGFGSTWPAPAEQLEALVRDTVERTRPRVVVGGGWAGWSVAHDDVYRIEGIDHRWLFPQVAAAVHHAGAGTTDRCRPAGWRAVRRTVDAVTGAVRLPPMDH
jgi:UDP:flavonoid glycosyltransferase YjiC (YdhE family)